MKADNQISVENLEEFLIDWNLKFKFDRLYRKKYNIPFGSKAHLEANQVDIYLDILEDKMMNRLQKEYDAHISNLEDYNKTGKFLKEQQEDPEAVEKMLKNFRLR